MPKKRKFIKKENAVNFYLMRRGQQDPLTVDENAPEHVLFPLHSKSNDAETQEDEKYEVVFDEDFEYLQRLEAANDSELKPTKTVQWDLVPVERNPQTKRQRKLKLPSSVFASEVEEKVGLLNKAAPDTGLNLDLDPELVAAMADDFDYDNPENELADDFMQFADKPGSDVEEEEEDTEESGDDSHDFDSENDEVRSKFGNCDTKSYYSLVTCNPDQDRNLLYLEALYERTKEDYYNNDDDTEKDKYTGADEERVLAMLLEDFEKSKVKVHLDKDQEAIDITKKMVENLASDEEYEEIVVHKKYVPQIRKPSTKNQPKLIEIPNDKPKKKPPRIIEESSDSEDSETESIASKISTLSIRPKNETPEERRERKHGIKGLRRIRREQKKENSLLFKEEKKRQVKLAVSQQNNQRMKRIN